MDNADPKEYKIKELEYRLEKTKARLAKVWKAYNEVKLEVAYADGLRRQVRDLSRDLTDKERIIAEYEEFRRNVNLLRKFLTGIGDEGTAYAQVLCVIDDRVYDALAAIEKHPFDSNMSKEEEK